MTEGEIIQLINELLNEWDTDNDEDAYYKMRDIERVLGREPKP